MTAFVLKQLLIRLDNHSVFLMTLFLIYFQLLLGLSFLCSTYVFLSQQAQYKFLLDDNDNDEMQHTYSWPVLNNWRDFMALSAHWGILCLDLLSSCSILCSITRKQYTEICERTSWWKCEFWRNSMKMCRSVNVATTQHTAKGIHTHVDEWLERRMAIEHSQHQPEQRFWQVAQTLCRCMQLASQTAVDGFDNQWQVCHVAIDNSQQMEHSVTNGREMTGSRPRHWVDAERIADCAREATAGKNHCNRAAVTVAQRFNQMTHDRAVSGDDVRNGGWSTGINVVAAQLRGRPLRALHWSCCSHSRSWCHAIPTCLCFLFIGGTVVGLLLNWHVRGRSHNSTRGADRSAGISHRTVDNTVEHLRTSNLRECCSIATNCFSISRCRLAGGSLSSHGRKWPPDENADKPDQWAHELVAVCITRCGRSTCCVGASQHSTEETAEAGPSTHRRLEGAVAWRVFLRQDVSVHQKRSWLDNAEDDADINSRAAIYTHLHYVFQKTTLSIDGTDT